jgi:hypothetical protein
MKFFNKKEEVIDLELTSYGETLMSMGMFKPVYYAFYDDNILYDASGSAEVQEIQNDVEARIQENTVQIKTQALHRGAEQEVRGLVLFNFFAAAVLDPDDPGRGIRTAESAFFPHRYENEFSLNEPIGTMELGSTNAPSWDIRALKGELSGAINYFTGSTSSTDNSNVRRIPQLDFNVNYKMVIGDGRGQSTAGGEIENYIISQVYQDGTFVYTLESEPGIILSIDENNASSDTEYDIEVYELLTGPNGAETLLIPLSFEKERSNVVNDILLDDDELQQQGELDTTIDMVRYYMDIQTDLEIPSEEICDLINILRTRGVEVNDIPYECDDDVIVGRFNIYETDLDSEEC